MSVHLRMCHSHFHLTQSHKAVNKQTNSQSQTMEHGKGPTSRGRGKQVNSVMPPRSSTVPFASLRFCLLYLCCLPFAIYFFLLLLLFATSRGDVFVVYPGCVNVGKQISRRHPRNYCRHLDWKVTVIWENSEKVASEFWQLILFCNVTPF